MITRRNLLLALGAGVVVAPLACFAQQQPPKIARIGLLEGASISTNRRAGLIAGLGELGLVEGKNIIIEYRGAEGKYDRLPGLAAQLVELKVDVIVAASSPAIRAAQEATTTIPIVMVRAGDPVATGFVTSLSRPGRNITGLSNVALDLSSKYLDLLRTALPKLSRVVVLANPANLNHSSYLKPLQATEKTNSVKILPVLAATTRELDAAFATIKQERPGALIVLGDPFFFAQGRRIAELAAQQRLPTIFATREAVEAGGLMSYGQNAAAHYHRAATYIDKILKGAKPADLPVEQPIKIELVINLKTAKALGLTIPQQLLLQADEVIE